MRVDTYLSEKDGKGLVLVVPAGTDPNSLGGDIAQTIAMNQPWHESRSDELEALFQGPRLAAVRKELADTGAAIAQAKAE